MRKTAFILLFVVAILSCQRGGYAVYDLKVNGITQAMGLEDPPVFSWKLRSEMDGTWQESYRIVVKDDRGVCFWDSGIVKDDKPFGIRYSGNKLPSGAFFLWELTSADNRGHKATGKGTFSTGLREADWQGRWIEMSGERKPYQKPGREQLIAEIMALAGLSTDPAPFDPEEYLDPPVAFRKTFVLNKKIRRATAYATAHGIYSLSLNGKEVSEELAPGITTYPRYLEYQQYDITECLARGTNTLEAVVADGWWAGKLSVQALGNQFGERTAFLCQLMIDYADGSREVIGSDASFEWSNDGPWRYADLTEGEMYDASRAYGNWQPCREAEYGYSNLTGRKADPVCVVRAIPAKRILHTPGGDTLIDFGENLAGRVHPRLKGHKGDTVTLVHQEVLDKDGNLFYTMKGRCRNQRTRYIFGEDGEADFTPQFCWQGFQYVKVTGLKEVRAQDFTAEVLSTDLQPTGGFRCSDSLLTRLQENIVRSQVSNMISIPTDCPQREKAGWTGDMQIFAPTAVYNRDVQAFLEKWLVNMRLDQAPDGSVPDVTPAFPLFNATSANGCAGWGDAAIVVPWALYQAYGDPKVLEDNYEMMEKWHAFVEAETIGYLWDKDRFQYGEWLIPSIPEAYMSLGEGRVSYNIGQDEISTAMYYRSTLLLSRIAGLLGKDGRADELAALAENIREAFCKAYIREDGTMSIDMQGQYVLALGLEMVADQSLKKKMQEQLVRLVRENGNRLNTGFIPTPFLMDVLTDIDPSLAMDVLFQTESPSWLYEVSKGATTMWEGWTQILPDGTVKSGSFNHFAYGCVGDYLYRRILGIAPSTPAYRTILIDPIFPDRLDWAEGWHDTPYGRISLRWERMEKGGISLELTLPPGCEADIFTPDGILRKRSGRHQIAMQ